LNTLLPLFVCCLLAASLSARSTEPRPGEPVVIGLEEPRKARPGEGLAARRLMRRLEKRLARQVGARPVAADSCELVVLRSGDSLRVDLLWTTAVQIAYRPCGSRQSNVLFFYKHHVRAVYDARGRQVFPDTGEIEAIAKANGSRGLALASLLCGIGAWLGVLLAIALFTAPLLSFLLALASLVMGIVALKKTRRGRRNGRGMAIVGLVLSGIFRLLGVMAMIFLLTG
jgi:hypothetical protein